CCASSQSICSMAPIPAVRQKRSKELSTSCQAVSRLGTSASDEGVIVVVMALLSFGIRHPEPNGSRWATPPSLIQQRPGQSPVLWAAPLLGEPTAAEPFR